jgi:pimeloyl-ACP methyl ester carboxylesterase
VAWTALDQAGQDAIGRRADGTYRNSLSATMSISLLDFACPEGVDADGIRAATDAIAARDPRIGVFFGSLLGLCAHWTTVRPSPAVPIDASTAPKLLMYAGLHDPATPYENAAELLDALGNDSYLVTWEGNGHGALHRNLCTMGTAFAFAEDPLTAPLADTCPP